MADERLDHMRSAVQHALNHADPANDALATSLLYVGDCVRELTDLVRETTHSAPSELGGASRRFLRIRWWKGDQY